MVCLGDSLQPRASRGVTIHSPKHHKVLSPSPQGAAGPGMGKKEAAGVPPGLPLCTEAVRESRTLYKPWNGCVEIRSLFPEIGSCKPKGLVLPPAQGSSCPWDEPNSCRGLSATSHCCIPHSMGTELRARESSVNMGHFCQACAALGVL